MKTPKILFLSALLSCPAISSAQVAYGGAVIPMGNVKVTPSGIEQPGSEANKIADMRNGSENSIFHTLWKGIPKQTIVLEGDLAGEGASLDLILLDPRRAGLNGLIKEATLWVQSNGTYQKVATIHGKLDNVPVFIRPKKEIRNPKKIKLVVTDAYGDQTNGNYMVSLGELMCLCYQTNVIVEAQLRQIKMAAAKVPMTDKVAAYDGKVIPMKTPVAFPAGIGWENNDADKLIDGKNFGENTEFHTRWGGIPKQEVTLEAELEGRGMRMDQVVLDQRALGFGGIIKEATIWVQTGGAYQKVADVQSERKNGRLIVPLMIPVWHPEKIKIIITDTYSDNGGYQVCLGEMACVMLP